MQFCKIRNSLKQRDVMSATREWFRITFAISDTSFFLNDRPVLAEVISWRFKIGYIRFFRFAQPEYMWDVYLYLNNSPAWCIYTCSYVHIHNFNMNTFYLAKLPYGDIVTRAWLKKYSHIKWNGLCHANYSFTCTIMSQVYGATTCTNVIKNTLRYHIKYC